MFDKNMFQIDRFATLDLLWVHIVFKACFLIHYSSSTTLYPITGIFWKRIKGNFSYSMTTTKESIRYENFQKFVSMIDLPKNFPIVWLAKWLSGVSGCLPYSCLCSS